MRDNHDSLAFAKTATPIMEVIDMRFMSTVKSVFIFVLSVALALETGFTVAYGMALKVLYEDKSRQRLNYRMSYRDFYEDRKSS